MHAILRSTHVLQIIVLLITRHIHEAGMMLSVRRYFNTSFVFSASVSLAPEATAWGRRRWGREWGVCGLGKACSTVLSSLVHIAAIEVVPTFLQGRQEVEEEEGEQKVQENEGLEEEEEEEMREGLVEEVKGMVVGEEVLYEEEVQKEEEDVEQEVEGWRSG